MAVSYVIPTVGMSGYYKLLAPFDQTIEPNSIYTCQAVRSITDLLSTNEEPLNTIYLKNGLTKEEYETDVAERMLIVTLQGGFGEWVQIPVKYIQTYPLASGVLYHRLGIAVGLGMVPVNMDVTMVGRAIEEAVYGVLAVTPSIKPIQLSKPTLLTEDQHAEIEANRTGILELKPSLQKQLDDKTAECERLRNVIKNLEQFILSHNLQP